MTDLSATAYFKQAIDEHDSPKIYKHKALTYGPEGYIEKEFEVHGPLYHGGGKRLREGDQLKPGRRTNPWGDEGNKSRHVHFTTSLDTAAEYAKRSGGHVYEVEPTGDFKHDYSAGDYKTKHPLNVVRRLDPEEWDHAASHQPDSTTGFFKQVSGKQQGPTETEKDGKYGNQARGAKPRDRAGNPASGRHGAQTTPCQPEPASRGRRQASTPGQEQDVERHPELQGDLDQLGGGARHVQDTIDTLHRGGSGLTTYPLSHPLEGWHAAISGGGHQVVHRHDPDTKTLHVGYAGHNIAEAEERLGGASAGSSTLPVEFHNSADKDFDKLHPDVQDKALDVIDRLARRESHPHDHILAGPLSKNGWKASRIDFLHRVTHRYEDEHGRHTSPEKAARLFVGHLGPHNYEETNRRLAVTAFFRQTAEVNEETTVRMVAPEEYRKFHFPDYPQAKTLPALVRHFKKTDPEYYAKVRDDVKKNGFTTPILVQYKDQRGKPLAKPYVREGHHRAAVAHELGLHLPVGDYDNEADFQRSSQGNADWFKNNPRSPKGVSWHTAALDKGIDNEGHEVELDPIDGWRHKDGSVSHDDGTVISDHPVTELTATAYFKQAAAQTGTGIMIAFVPPREIAEQLAQHGTEPVEDLHITLAYLGKTSDYTREELAWLPELVGSWAARQKPVTIRIGGVGKFSNPYKDEHVLWANADIPGGTHLHSDLEKFLKGHGYRYPSEHGWTPHMTLSYVDKHFRFIPNLPELSWPATEVVTSVGGCRTPAPLGGLPRMHR